ncbi:hypothetical protein, partial [Phenylobacterium sp.]|uniref:hypothetical protein n=1 Tax=Phenylobacterium sp. TaxID=1871053 RepID=UPI00286A00F0
VPRRGGINPEGFVKRPAGGDDPQFRIQDEERFMDGVHYRLCERLGVFDSEKRVQHCCCYRHPFSGARIVEVSAASLAGRSTQ